MHSVKLFTHRRFVSFALIALSAVCISLPLTAWAQASGTHTEKNDAPLTPPEVFYNQASEAYNAGQYDKAIDLFTQAIKGRATFSDAYFNRGLAYEAKSDWKKAIADFTTVIANKPRLTDTYLERARCHMNDGNTAAAFIDLTKAIEIKPNLEEAYVVRGDLYYSSKQYNKAVADYTKYLEVGKPTNFSIFKKRGQAYSELQNWSAVISDLKRYLKFVPTDEEARLLLDKAIVNLSE